jgi:hypothetical protein
MYASKLKVTYLSNMEENCDWMWPLSMGTKIFLSLRRLKGVELDLRFFHKDPIHISLVLCSYKIWSPQYVQLVGEVFKARTYKLDNI